jgi:2-oxoisovalerate dehydrogenase E1 component alpha subunit
MLHESVRSANDTIIAAMADAVQVVATDDPVRALFSSAGELTAQARSRLGLEAPALRDLYHQMVLIRRADQEALNLQRQGELGLWGQYLGQEAIHVGAVAALHDDDWIFPSYREFGMAMCRGIDPADMLTLFRGFSHGPWDPRIYHFAPLAIPVASQVPHAVGFAMGSRLKHTDDVTLVTFGDGATSKGDWHEALNFAGVFRAPVIFLCQNNHWAISVPLARQTAGSIAERAVGYGFPGIRIDGNDVLGVYAAVRAAGERARHGDGPYLIEAMTYRMGAHTSSDDPTRYRLESELQTWSSKDPIARYRAWLQGQQVLDDASVKSIDQEAEVAAERMRTRLRSISAPAAGEAIFGRVYGRPPDSFREEREEFEASLEGS